jgi:hypothetical protein
VPSTPPRKQGILLGGAAACGPQADSQAAGRTSPNGELRETAQPKPQAKLTVTDGGETALRSRPGAETLRISHAALDTLKGSTVDKIDLQFRIIAIGGE